MVRRIWRIIALVAFIAALVYGLVARDYELLGFGLGAVAGIPIGLRLGLVGLGDVPFLVICGLLLVGVFALPVAALFAGVPQAVGMFLSSLALATSVQAFARRYGEQLEGNRSR